MLAVIIHDSVTRRTSTLQQSVAPVDTRETEPAKDPQLRPKAVSASGLKCTPSGDRLEISSGLSRLEWRGFPDLASKRASPASPVLDASGPGGHGHCSTALFLSTAQTRYFNETKL